LICGFVGCSRYKNKHSIEHFLETKHTYALELESQRVWDYTKEAFVHRLVSNRIDGKMVEIPDYLLEEERGNMVKQNDLTLDPDEALALEWQYLLAAAIETQKKHFEERIQQVEQQNTKKIGHLEEEYHNLLREKTETQKKLEIIAQEKKSLEKKTEVLGKKIEDVSKETQFLHTMNDALAKNQAAWLEKIKEAEERLKQSSKDQRIRELEDKVRDLMSLITTNNEDLDNQEKHHRESK